MNDPMVIDEAFRERLIGTPPHPVLPFSGTPEDLCGNTLHGNPSLISLRDVLGQLHLMLLGRLGVRDGTWEVPAARKLRYHTTAVTSGHTERLTQVETRSASHDQELSRMSTRARVLEVRVQVLEHERERYETTLTTTRAKLADALGRLASLREDMGEMRGRVSSAEALAHAVVLKMRFRKQRESHTSWRNTRVFLSLLRLSISRGIGYKVSKR